MDSHAAKAPGFSVQKTGSPFFTRLRHCNNTVIITNGEMHCRWGEVSGYNAALLISSHQDCGPEGIGFFRTDGENGKAHIS